MSSAAVIEHSSGARPRDRARVRKNGLTEAVNAFDQLEVQAMALAGYVIAGQRRIAFNVVANHTPIRGPDGQYSEDPEVLGRAFTAFENHEGITSLLNTSQLGD